MEHMRIWSICVYGAYAYMEHMRIWSICVYGAYAYMEHMRMWSICVYGAYAYMEHMRILKPINSTQYLSNSSNACQITNESIIQQVTYMPACHITPMPGNDRYDMSHNTNAG